MRRGENDEHKRGKEGLKEEDGQDGEMRRKEGTKLQKRESKDGIDGW